MNTPSVVTRVADYAVYLMALPLFGVLYILPWHFMRALLYRLAGGLYYVDRRHREIVLRNLTHAFGEEKTEEEIRAIAKEVFRNVGYLASDVIQMLKIDEHNVDEYFDFEGIEIFHKALAADLPAVAFLAHFGNWELLGAHPIKFGGDYAIPVKRIKNPHLQAFVESHRARFDVEILPAHGSVRRIIRKLKNKGIVGFLIDQRARTKDGVIVDFFGRPVRVIGSVARLALTLDVPVAMGLAWRVPHAGTHGYGRYKIYYSDEVPIVRTGNMREDIVTNTQRFMKMIEDKVRQDPAQWFWLHDLWRVKTRDGRVDLDAVLDEQRRQTQEPGLVERLDGARDPGEEEPLAATG